MTDTSAVPQRTKRGLDIRTAAELGDLLHELTHDKKTRGKLGRIIREAKPDSPHAAAFTDVEVEDKFEELQRKRDEDEIKRQQDAIVVRMNTQRQRLLTGGEDGAGPKYDEDTIKKIESLMEKKGITDYEDGAVLFAATQPPITKPNADAPKHGSTWEFPEWAAFKDDPKRTSYKIAEQVIDEFQQRRPR